jgi:hypothetical protein
MTTVLVADDHPLFREAIADALRTMFDRVGVLEAGSMTEAIDQVANANDIDLLTDYLGVHDWRTDGLQGLRTAGHRAVGESVDRVHSGAKPRRPVAGQASGLQAGSLASGAGPRRLAALGAFLR